MAEKDFRVRYRLLFTNAGVARGLANHSINQTEKAVNINEGLDNEELVCVTLNGGIEVIADLNFPPEHEEVATGLIVHLKDIIDQVITLDPEVPSYFGFERCGHRMGESCETIEEYYVE